MSESETTERTKVRGYLPQDEPQVMEIIERVWGANVRADHAFLWKWKHELDAGRQNDGAIAKVVEAADGRIVGYSGAIPIKIKMKDRILEGIFCMDTFTDPTSRGSGIRLMRNQLKSSSITFGAGNPRAKELWARLAKKENPVIRDARKIALIMDPSDILTTKGVPRIIAKPLGAFWRSFVNLRSRRVKPSDDPLRLERVDSFPSSIDKVCSEFSKDFKFIVIRDHNYLNWRFVSCPFEYEKWVLWKDGEPAGYMVYRVGMLNNRKIMILVEMMAVGKKREYYQAMLSRLFQSAKNEGVSDIQTMETGCKVFEDELIRSGFFYKKENLPLIGSVHDDLLADYDIYVSDDWYLSVGDADFEVIFFRQGINSVIRSKN